MSPEALPQAVPAPAGAGPDESLGWLFGPQRSARMRRVAILCLFPAVVLVGTLQFDFVFDDNIVVLGDPLIAGRWSLGRIFGSEVRVADVTLGYYRPLITLSYRLDRALWGMNPAGYHLTNLLLHLAATLLVYAVARRTLRQTAAAWTAAVLFAVLPAHAEAIGWIQGRVDLLAAALALVALWALLRSQEVQGRPGWGWGGAGALAFFLALLAKESAAPLPLAWAAWEIAAPEPERRRTWLARFAPLAVAFLAYWLLRREILGAGVHFPLGFSPLWPRLVALGCVLAEYARILFLPDTTLNLHRVLRIHAGPGAVAVAAGMAAVLAGGLLLAWRHRRDLFPWAAWGPIMLAPPLLFIWYAPAPDLGYFTAERFVYLPSVGWCALAGVLLSRALQAQRAAGLPRAGWCTCGALVVAYAGLTVLRLAPWADSVDLYHGMQVHPDQPLEIRLFIHNNLGGVYLDRGDFPAAEREFQTALRLRPDYPFALSNLGVLRVRQGRPAEAVPWFERAIRLDPTYADAYANLGAAHEAVGDRAAARSAYAAGLQHRPDSARLREGLARVGGTAPIATEGRHP